MGFPSGGGGNGGQGGGVGNGGWPTGGGYGGSSGAGGYNPQLMPGMGNDVQFQGGTPFWQPWPGWNEEAGTHNTAQGNMDQGAAKVPGAPDWLQHQMGDYMNLPFYTNPNQYGRFNWATNLQGGGIPSPFGQYAQQFAQYPPLQFPPPPTYPPGGQPPPPGGQPPPPGPPPPNPNGDIGDMVRQWTYMGSNDPNKMAAFNQIAARGGAGADAGDAAQNQAAGGLINQYSAGGTGYNSQKSGDAYTRQMLTDPGMAAWRAQNPQWVAAAQKAVGGK